MPITRRGFITSCLSAGAFALTGCSVGEPVHRERWYLFGTLLDVSIPVGDDLKLRPALSALTDFLREANHQWHAWKPGELLKINQAFARGEAIAVDPTLSGLITDATAVSLRSGGAFNPAIGGVVALWGFHNDELPKGAPPKEQQIERLLSDSPSLQDVVVKQGMISSVNPSVQLDFGGYGKGYALDVGMDLLQRYGISDAIINAGGDLCATGTKSGRPWRIAVRHPQGKGVLAWLDTNGSEGVYTSGNYERYREDAGKRYTHIIDPRNGMPVEEIVSSTVVHANGALADAAATALSVAGTRHWHAVAEALGVSQAMVVDNTGRVQITRSLADRIHLDLATWRQTAIV